MKPELKAQAFLFGKIVENKAKGSEVKVKP